MRYCDLRPAVEAHSYGENVTQRLRSLLDEKCNTPLIIEIAYDLQAGHRSDTRVVLITLEHHAAKFEKLWRRQAVVFEEDRCIDRLEYPIDTTGHT